MSDFVQGIMLGVALALAAGALAMYLSRVNAAPPGQAEEPTGRKQDDRPKSIRERRS
jgi:hypothetical protein